MDDELIPEVGDTVEFSAGGPYGTYEDHARGTITAVYKNGGIKVNSKHGVYKLPKREFILLSKAG